MKLTFIFFALAICASVGIGVWLAFANPFAVVVPGDTGMVPAVRVDAPTEISGRTNLTALQNVSDEPVECVLQVTTQAGEVREGTAFIASSQMRVDVLDVSTSTADTNVSSFVVDSGVITSWNTDATAASSTAESADDEETAGNGVAKIGSVALSDIAQYSCRPWVVDASVFSTP